MYCRAVFCAALITVTASASRASAKELVVILPLRADGVPEKVMDALNDLLVFSVDEHAPYDTVSPDDLDAQLGLEGMKDVMGCDDVACAVEIAGVLDARFLISGSVRKLGSRIYVGLSLIDTQSRKAVNRGKSRVKDDPDLYEQAIEEAVQKVFGVKSRAAPAPQTQAGTSTTDDSPGWKPCDDALATAFSRAGFQLIRWQQMKKALTPKTLDKLRTDCDKKCKIAVGRATGGDYIIKFRIKPNGNDWSVLNSVIETKTGSRLMSAHHVADRTESAIVPTALQAADRMVQYLTKQTGRRLVLLPVLREPRR